MIVGREGMVAEQGVVKTVTSVSEVLPPSPYSHPPSTQGQESYSIYAANVENHQHLKVALWQWGRGSYKSSSHMHKWTKWPSLWKASSSVETQILAAGIWPEHTQMVQSKGGAVMVASLRFECLLCPRYHSKC